MVKNESITYFSRSALAEKLGVTLKELTQGMMAAGWLLHQEDVAKGKEWTLTAKGEFEGGIYRESNKFGQYIVWPESVVHHAAIVELSEAHVNVSVIAKHYKLSAKIMNRLFSEIAWVEALSKGWQLTELGRIHGGLQKQDSETGISYVVWSRKLLQHTYLQEHVFAYQGETSHLTPVVIDQHTYYIGLDGHYLRSQEELVIANWLYVMGIPYAYRRNIVLQCVESVDKGTHTCGGDIVLSDFYLPKGNIHIHFIALAESPERIKAQLLRQELAKKYQLNTIEIGCDEVLKLDQLLPKALLRWGIDVF